MNPKAKPDLLVEALPDETLVYDLERHRAHCLNPVAALILSAADGSRDLDALREEVEGRVEAPVTKGVVRLGLDRLRRARLLEWDGTDFGVEGLSRRQAIGKLAGIGMVLPSVLTIAAAQGRPGTKITPADCRRDGSLLGRCCTNSRRCVQDGPRRRCVGSPC